MKNLPGTFYPQLDTLRWFSVLGVMISHWFVELNFVHHFPFGDGVLMFFVLSGFLIGNILMGQKEYLDAPGNNSRNKFYNAFKSFYVRRALRIFPAYYATILIFYFLRLPEIHNNFLWFMTYCVNFKIMQIDSWLANASHLWSLSIEEQFYLIFPILIFVTPRKWQLKLIIGMILLAWTSKFTMWFLNFSSYDVVMFTLNSFDYLGLGVLLAYLKRYTTVTDIIYQKRQIILSIIVMIFAALLVVDYFHFTSIVNWILIPVTFSFFSVMVILVCIYGVRGKMKKILEFPAFLYLGKISYGLYLYHNLVPTLDILLIRKLTFLNELSRTSMILCEAGIHLFFTLIIASLSFMLFEQPINRLKRYFNYN
jgi:peptidoglycan/LPS O-acetylase OafA/YrhL